MQLVHLRWEARPWPSPILKAKRNASQASVACPAQVHPGCIQVFFFVSATISSYSSSELDMADVTDMAVGCCGMPWVTSCPGLTRLHHCYSLGILWTLQICSLFKQISGTFTLHRLWWMYRTYFIYFQLHKLNCLVGVRNSYMGFRP